MSFIKFLYPYLTYLYLMPFALIGIIAGFTINKSYPSVRHLDNVLTTTIRVNLFLIVTLAISYLLYPSYLDHLESTVASLGLIYSNGGQIYPPLSDYTFHGLLYGPGLSEIQSAFRFFGLPVIFSSKIPGVLAFLIATLLLCLTLKNKFSRAYLIFLVPFGLFLFWNRAEPFLLLLVSLSLWILSHSTNLGAAFVIGCFAGFASSLKLHGILYILAAIAVAFPCDKLNIKTILLFSIGTLLTIILTFLPDQISIFNFLIYIELASKHGLSKQMLLENFIYLFILSLPVLYIAIKNATVRIEFIGIASILLTIEGITAIISSKPGSGIHHLIPFIPINAFLLQRIFMSGSFDKQLMKPFKFGLIAVSLATSIPLLLLSWQITSKFKIQDESKAEIEKISKEYPGTVLGISDAEGYLFTFHRPLLEAKGTKQVDFPAYMDLNYSGVSDHAFLKKIQLCEFSHIAVPASGKPFSMNNFYNDKPLLSNEVRLAFEENYKILSKSKYYNIYSCKSKAPN